MRGQEPIMMRQTIWFREADFKYQIAFFRETAVIFSPGFEKKNLVYARIPCYYFYRHKFSQKAVRLICQGRNHLSILTSFQKLYAESIYPHETTTDRQEWMKREASACTGVI